MCVPVAVDTVGPVAMVLVGAVEEPWVLVSGAGVVKVVCGVLVEAVTEGWLVVLCCVAVLVRIVT